jgi:N-acyl-phosphatidylethanolamine-hydrolysing phospholipase D
MSFGCGLKIRQGYYSPHMINHIIKLIKSSIISYLLFILGFLGLAIIFTGLRGNSPVNEVSPHYISGKFRNLHTDTKNRRGDFFRWRFGLGPQEAPALPPKSVPTYRPQILTPDLNTLHHADPDNIQITWIGHDTFLIQVAGLNILTDPIFSERASPFSFLGPKRIVPPAMQLDDLPPIQATIISHNHYDHLDAATIAKLRNNTTFFVPLKMSEWFRAMGVNSVTELDWWQSASRGAIRFHCVPAQHFSMRTPFDANTVLWCGWVLTTPAGTLYFAGDTGYSADFKEIGERFGPMRLALIPIGGYMPRWFMKPMHLNPVEAVLVHQDVQAQQSIGMHWGTFNLTEEPPAEPPLFLEKVLKERNINPDTFITLKFGETKILRPNR